MQFGVVTSGGFSQIKPDPLWIVHSEINEYPIHLVRRGQTVVIAHLVMRLKLLSIKRRFWRRLLNNYFQRKVYEQEDHD
jgi:hypothetical protein